MCLALRSSTLNEKNLNSEIETTQVKRQYLLSILQLSMKRISILRLKLHNGMPPLYQVVTLNEKNLNSEIETGWSVMIVQVLMTSQ